MLNLGRNDRWVDVKDSTKPEAKPTVSNAIQQPSTPTSTVRPSQSPGATLRETTTREMPSAPAPAPAPFSPPAPVPLFTPAPLSPPPAPPATEPAPETPHVALAPPPPLVVPSVPRLVEPAPAMPPLSSSGS